MQENFCKEHIRRRAEHLIRNCTRKKKKVAYGGVIRLHTSQKNCSAFPFIKSDTATKFLTLLIIKRTNVMHKSGKNTLKISLLLSSIVLKVHM